MVSLVQIIAVSNFVVIPVITKDDTWHEVS